MQKLGILFVLIGILSCEVRDNSNNSNHKNNIDSDLLIDKEVRFMWRGNKYDSLLNDSLSAIFLNHEFINSISDAERAAIGYVATFVGNDCWWDGETKEDRSNLDCRILSALKLGYQCSDKHLGFLNKWFALDKEVLASLKKNECPTIPYTATSQNTFDRIDLRVKGDTIHLSYDVSGINMREQNSWQWSSDDTYLSQGDNIKLLKRKKTDVTYESFNLLDDE